MTKNSRHYNNFNIYVINQIRFDFTSHSSFDENEEIQGNKNERKNNDTEEGKKCDTLHQQFFNFLVNLPFLPNENMELEIDPELVPIFMELPIEKTFFSLWNCSMTKNPSLSTENDKFDT